MPGLRCADWAREANVDPIGSAPSPWQWLLIEWPLPWPRDASEVEALHSLSVHLERTGTRLQLLVPAANGPKRLIVLHRRSVGEDATAVTVRRDDWFAGYERTARSVEPSGVLAAAVDLLDGGEGDPDSAAAEDVLVCSHGARDRCCGSLGTSLALQGLADGVHLRRTSHTGGHRFAPTAIILPQGTAWAFLDPDALARITSRSGTLDDILPRYRGTTAFGAPAIQAVERVVFREVGWSWLDHRRRGIELGDGTVRVEAVAPDGSERSWEATVASGRTLPVPDCGRAVEHAKKFETEVVVRAARRLA